MDQRDIGKFIASCRKNKEMTQSELAEKLGVSINAVSKWERGINLPDYSNLQELCSVLGISLNEFFAGRHLEDSEIERQSEKNLLSVVKQSELDRQRKKWDRAFKLVVLAIVIFAAGRFVLAMNGYVPALDRMYIKEYGTGTVGDADMAMHELKDGSQSSWSAAEANDGITWFKKFKERYRHSIWLHPQEREENTAWMPESFVEIEKVFPMFRLSIDGLKEGMYKLLRG